MHNNEIVSKYAFEFKQKETFDPCLGKCITSLIWFRVRIIN